MKLGNIYKGRDGWFFEVWSGDCLLAYGWKPTRESAYAAMMDAQAA